MLLKYPVRLAGIANVLEALELSFKGSLSAQFHDLHCLQESISKSKQVLVSKIFVYTWRLHYMNFLFFY